jgi:formate hydrogenlyase subunit 3/multisubunit Na+/H+ antiporter MnhD subunit
MPFLRVKWKGITAVSVVIVNAALSGILALKVLLGDPLEIIFQGTLITGNIAFRMDALSGWFILVINFTIITGALYGLQYSFFTCTINANFNLYGSKCNSIFICMGNNGLIRCIAGYF